ncbi:circadian-associated transcriptional repressor [Electrophorus electricus]|uniref:Circadian associated repressor of transcription a n=1 Tax=Electrophorus electricus TaxID=8005 RepID=A0A4W4DUM5_ELEEL|nr:circadian-associated transcriptional repressor [Electrophorus electricus]XP_026859050.2 circadian-associated transcriptional repressor [Electrophorus electricus]XP_026859051.2 circadian-associated transcriptional repressor [Electrophorus electricus]
MVSGQELRPRMSASDSECSIDWLASDDEGDVDSEPESECERTRRMRAGTPATNTVRSPRPSEGSTDSPLKEETARYSRSCSPSSCASSLSVEGELSPVAREDRSVYNRTSGSPKGKSRQAPKRAQSSATLEPKEKQLATKPSEKDQLFACKCVELQCYIHPLSSILNGLRSGRYRERLSTFQESVAMDRIQRIMGVLQNPCMGERYVDIILKMEEMLKSWFPHVKPHPQTAATKMTQETAPPKKPKLSSAMVSPATTSAPPVGSKALQVSDLTPPGPYSATNLKWLHTTPICSPTAEQAQGTVRNFLTTHSEEDVTQDNSVSSTMDNPHMEPVPSQPPLGKINAPCLERLLKSTESIISQKGSGGAGNMAAGGWS